MGIDGHFYYVVVDSTDSTAAGEKLLLGVDFHGGLNSAALQHLGECNWVVHTDGQSRLVGKLDVIHQQGRGNRLALRDSELPALPFVITTNSKVSWLYSGGVNVVASDNSFDFKGLAELGIPLLGENWFGVLRRCGDELRLDAYSTGDVPQERTVNAFCPDWTEGFDDQDALIFMIERW